MGLRSSMPAGCDRHGLTHRERLDVIVFKLASFFHFGFTRCQHSHLTLSHRLGVGFDQPDFTGEAVHLVSGIHRPARRSDRIHSTEQKSDDKNQYRGGSCREDFFINGFIHVIIPAELSLLILAPLALQPLYLLALAVELGLVPVDLLLLLVIGVLLTLQLIAY